MMVSRHSRSRARERLTNDERELQNLAKHAFRQGENIPVSVYSYGKRDYSKVTIKKFRDYYWVFAVTPRVKLITLYREEKS